MRRKRAALSAADLQRVLAAVLQLNAARSIAALSRDGVAAILRLIPADAFSMQLLRLNGTPVFTITDPSWPYTKEQVDYYCRHAGEHPMVRYYAAHGIGYALRMSDAIPLAAFKRHPIYTHCMGPHGLHRTLGILLKAGPGRHTGIAFDRRRRDFTPREMALLEALAPHISQLLERLELDTGTKKPWREPTTRDWLAGDLGVSNREAELLLLLLEGRSNREIAAAVRLSVGTVKKHLENAFRKLGTPHRLAAAALVRERLG